MMEFVNGFRMTSHIWNGQSSKCLKPPTRVNSLSITQQATSLFTKRKLLIENRQLQIAGMEARKWLYSGMSRLASGADHLEPARLDDGEVPWSIYIPYFFCSHVISDKTIGKKKTKKKKTSSMMILWFSVLKAYSITSPKRVWWHPKAAKHLGDHPDHPAALHFPHFPHRPKWSDLRRIDGDDESMAKIYGWKKVNTLWIS